MPTQPLSKPKPLRRAIKSALRAGGVPDYLRDALLFEARSFIGRRRGRRLDPRGPGPHLVNLGSGIETTLGFINVDFFGTPRVDFAADLRFALEIPDASVDGVFTEHTLEHLEIGQVERVLSECFRILKPGAYLRIIVPDVGEFARRYVAGDDAWFRAWEEHVLLPRGRHMRSPMEALSFVTQEYGHRSAWDAALMRASLESAGFTDAREEAYGRGSDPRLLVDRNIPSRTMFSLYMEARRTP